MNAQTRVGHADNFDGLSAQLEGRVVDNGGGRSWVACLDTDGAVWFTDMRYHAAPVWQRASISWREARTLILAYECELDAHILWREGYSEAFIQRYTAGLWTQAGIGAVL